VLLKVLTNSQNSIPAVIRFSGRLRNGEFQPGVPIDLDFSLYREATGGVSLWKETQNVKVDSQGRFVVFLGASSGGLPTGLFSSGEANWLGVTSRDGVEDARVFLASVPYALEALDAQTVGGRAAEELVTKEQLSSYFFRPGPVGPIWGCKLNCPVAIAPLQATSQAGKFEAVDSTGPSFISDATTAPPFQVTSTALVQNLNVDLLHGFADSDFAKINANNQFGVGQQFNAGVLFPPIPGSGNAPQSSSTQDFEAMGISNGSSISQTFRWQASGSGPNLAQPQLGLSFGAAGQTPQPTGLSVNSDGTVNFAPGQSFPGSAIMTAILPLLPEYVTPGGNGNGDVSPSPTGNQTVTQPPGTSLNVNNLNNTRTVQATDNWAFGNLTTPLTAGGQVTLTLAPCPVGVDTTGNSNLGGPNGGYPIRIVDGTLPNTNSETVYITGGTCTSGATSGTIEFTPFFSHAPSGYTIGSASQGIQEAINDACGTSSVPYSNSGCHIVLPPTGPQLQTYSGYDVYDTIYFHTNGSELSGYGAILNCHGRGPCLQVGDLRNANDYANNEIDGISFRSVDNRRSDQAFEGSLIQSMQRTGGVTTIQTMSPHNLRTGDRVTQMFTDSANYWGDVPAITVVDPTHYTYTRAGTVDTPVQVSPGVVALSYEAILDNANSTSFVDLQYENTAEYGAFNHFFDFWDDENAQISHFNNNGIGLNQNAYWSGSFVWSGGALALPNKNQQLAPVITVSNSNFTANGSNCATVYNSNGFYFQNSVCQAQGPWEFLISTITGNYQGAGFQNIYSEASVATNPASPVKSPWPGLGVAGFIGGTTAGKYTLTGQGSFSGAFPVVGSGPNTYVYYVVARDLTTGTQTSPLPFMYENESSHGSVIVQWPRVTAGTDTVVYDVVRNAAPSGTMQVAAGGYVAPYTGNCTGGSSSACGSVATNLSQCSGFVCSFVDNTANTTTAYVIRNGNFMPNPTFWPGTAVLTSTALQSDNELLVTGIAFDGAPSEYSGFCNAYGANVSGGYTVCSGSTTTANNSVPDQPPLMLTDGTDTGGGGVPGAKGRLIFESTATSEPDAHQIITLYDSNPMKTQATTGHRPVGDPGDMFLGIDSNMYMMLGGGAKGFVQYVNNIGDGASWGELLTGSLKTFHVPVLAPSINLTNGIQVNGSYGQSGQCLISTGTGSTWGSCGNASSTSSTDSDMLQPVDDRIRPTVTNSTKGGSLSIANNITYPSHASSLETSALKVESGITDRACSNGEICGSSGTPDMHSGGTISTTSSLMTFSSPIANGSCDDRSFNWVGIEPSRGIIPSWPPSLTPGLIGLMYISSVDTVTVRMCNFSGEAVTPGKLLMAATLQHLGVSYASVHFDVIGNEDCAAEVFFLSGVKQGSPIIPVWPTTLGEGMLGVMNAKADNLIEIRLCNFSGKKSAPVTQNYGVLLLR
jgi:hypothetical protein